MLGLMVPEWQEIINADPTNRTTRGPITVEMLNDSYYGVHSYIKTTMGGEKLSDAYKKAFPMKGGKHAEDVKQHLKATSLLLQQERWPYCVEVPKCQRPNTYHRADLTLNYVEMLRNQPEGFRCLKLFSVPFLIMEVEGAKGGRDKLDQQAKAMREVLVSLAVMPECYLVFIYPNGIELWKAVRNPARSKIDVTAERIDWDDGKRNLYQALSYFLSRIIDIFARAVLDIIPILEYNLSQIRINRMALATCHTKNPWERDCCDDCYTMDDIRSARLLNRQHPDVYLDYEGLPPTARPEEEELPEEPAARIRFPSLLCVKRKNEETRPAEKERGWFSVKKKNKESQDARGKDGRQRRSETVAAAEIKMEEEEEKEDTESDNGDQEEDDVEYGAGGGGYKKKVYKNEDED